MFLTISYTYSVFSNKIVGNITATKNDWNYSFNVTGGTVENDYYKVSLSGTSGSFNVVLDSTGYSDYISYSIKLDESNLSSDVKFYKDSSCLDEITDNIESDCIFIIDEISRKWDKNSKTDKQFYAFMNQCRKMRRILILITQEWRELPMWLRRPAKFMISTKPTRLLNKFGIYTSCVGDAENMVFDKDEGEYNCPPIKYIVYKRNREIANMYDTFEPINIL